MRENVKKICAGGAVGLANGLFGGGGGMIAVPALARTGLCARRAHATALAVVFPASLTSALVYLCFGLVPFALLLPVALGAATGGFFGAKLLARVSARSVTLVFAAFMLAAGVRMLL